MERAEPRTALVVGAVSRDFIAGHDGPVPGGVVFHAGSALARLQAQVRVVTRVRGDDASALLGPLDAEQVETLALPSRETTTYRLDYRGPVDSHELVAESDPIGPGDIPETWRRADLVHLGPLHRRDLLPEVPAVLEGFVGLDVQGLVRVAGAGGSRVSEFPGLPAFLANVDVLKASDHELPALLAGDTAEAFRSRYGVPELLVTRGDRGATLFTCHGERQVPVTPTTGTEIVGAGDVFLATYLLLRVSGWEPLCSAQDAGAVTALKVRHGQVPVGALP